MELSVLSKKKRKKEKEEKQKYKEKTQEGKKLSCCVGCEGEGGAHVLLVFNAILYSAFPLY